MVRPHFYARADVKHLVKNGLEVASYPKLDVFIPIERAGERSWLLTSKMLGSVPRMGAKI